MPLTNDDKDFITQAIFDARRTLQVEGFDRRGYAVLREVLWKDTGVRRRDKDGNEVHVDAIQELADAKSVAQSNQVVLARVVARFDAQAEALRQVLAGSPGGSIDMAAVEEAAERGAGRALEELNVSVTLSGSPDLIEKD